VATKRNPIAAHQVRTLASPDGEKARARRWRAARAWRRERLRGLAAWMTSGPSTFMEDDPDRCRRVVVPEGGPRAPKREAGEMLGQEPCERKCRLATVSSERPLRSREGMVIPARAFAHLLK
jgi:hypothetical protein